ncbi:MAG: hypothetical protein IJ007_01965 [Oscillospiraceae bacterium]|nr:hypothetical protein [Oscillospiraceae bacterium]
MGSWSESVTGNDTAQDLRSEYTCAFFKYDVDEALRLIDNYVRTEMFDESDEEEWCNYIYSLADYMWKKGILTDEIKEKALGMIDSGFGLELWAESGEKILAKRKAALEAFRSKITSPMPAKKKIKPDVHLEPIFNDGDIVAVKLMTAGKTYTKEAQTLRELTQEQFESYDGKYILMQKIRTFSSWHSYIVPEINDYWAVFRLFDGVYDELPESIDISSLKDAAVDKNMNPLFTCESSMFYFKKRKYRVLGNFPDEVKKYADKSNNANIFLGVNREWCNPDSTFLAYMEKQLEISEYSDSPDKLREIVIKANRWCAYDYKLSDAQNTAEREAEEKVIFKRIEHSVSEGCKIYTVSYGRTIGFITLLGKEITNFYIYGKFQNCGYGTKLLEYIIKENGDGLFARVPEIRNRERVIHILQKEGITIK